jgi:streptogramin lyase
MLKARTGVRAVLLLAAGLGIFAILATSAVQAAAPIGMLKQFSTPTANSAPRGITRGSDGNFWFTEGNVQNVGRITPGGAITEFQQVCASCSPNDIVQGPNNILYFTSNDSGLGRITTAGVVMAPVAPANTGALGNGMAAFGTDIWYASFVTHSIWRFNTVTSAFTEFVPPTPGSIPYDVAVDRNGIVWFTELGPKQIGRLDLTNPKRPAITETALTREPRQITIAADGSVWFTQRFDHAVGRLVPATNQVTEFPPFTGAPGPEGIAAAPDGSVWISQSDAGNVARLTLSATGSLVIAQGPDVKGSEPFNITVAPDGNPWYTELSANKIAVLKLK